jgi:hypothetical protein
VELYIAPLVALLLALVLKVHVTCCVLDAYLGMMEGDGGCRGALERREGTSWPLVHGT